MTPLVCSFVIPREDAGNSHSPLEFSEHQAPLEACARSLRANGQQDHEHDDHNGDDDHNVSFVVATALGDDNSWAFATASVDDNPLAEDTQKAVPREKSVVWPSP